ncbi:MAG: glycosyltransferase [Lachnospiraceae bacterium]|nr:glycosyltransferase [Lachnospiraceae bacterium]
MLKISVCMATYNGEKYIKEQLHCILEQTLQPDEVIVCDDGSTDGTVEIIREFIEDNNLGMHWKLKINQTNKGYPGNFYFAMSHCTGDVVFLADQDDIWKLDKLEKMTEQLKEHPDIKCLCCKFALVDNEGDAIFTIMKPTQNHGTGKLRSVTVGDVFYKSEWPGMVLAYRNEWYQTWSRELKNNQTVLQQIPHDFLLCARAGEERSFYQMDEELAYHRRHEQNVGGEEYRLSKLLNKRRKLQEIEDYLHILKAFSQGAVLRTEEGKRALEDKQSSMQERLAALESGKIGAVLSNAWRNRSRVRLATVICDVMIVKRKGRTN